jgi:NAD(P)-dependent dehydrogenase (short-subunit alcohol dehydrogenase family)
MSKRTDFAGKVAFVTGGASGIGVVNGVAAAYPLMVDQRPRSRRQSGS